MKTIFTILILSSAIFAQTNQKIDEERESFIKGLESVSPTIKDVITDYYNAKRCDNLKGLNTETIKEFSATSPIFAFLVALKNVNPIEYKKVLTNYKAIHCEKIELLGKKDITK